MANVASAWRGMRPVLLMVMIAALSGPTVLAQPSPLKVGMFTPFGLGPTFGPDSVGQINGAYMAALDRGYKVELVTSPNGCDTGGIAAEIEKMIMEDKVSAIIGPVCSGTTLAAAETVNRLKIPTISALSGAIAVSQAGPYVYRTYVTPSGILGALMTEVASKYGTIATITDDSLQGMDWSKLGSELYTKAGGKVLAAVDFVTAEQTPDTIGAVVKRAMDSMPDAIAIFATDSLEPDMEAALIKAVRAANPAFPLVMASGVDAQTVEMLGMTDPATNTTSYEMVGGIMKAADKAYGKWDARFNSMFGLSFLLDSANNGQQAYAYDAMSAIIRAAQKSGHRKLKGSDLNKVLSSKSFEFERYGGGLTKFDANGDEIRGVSIQEIDPATGMWMEMN
ncbi:hypothetical protein HYH03_014288 [Edaphochlamys debaryana]|uniref:Leucine-binding protein domain-containing protein n=1 Tax=Edaphochlamys debaryana TaxID=47281 RepID=A0A835XPA2_9CHLO|nr:hypothetical protein HYH03_014288 [Edaphochlamys debaryana]|eukprot:KAG2487042.1 hypothetical protein HYH03_014288 [Edaphochlamys debaryana]